MVLFNAVSLPKAASQTGLKFQAGLVGMRRGGITGSAALPKGDKAWKRTLGQMLGMSGMKDSCREEGRTGKSLWGGKIPKIHQEQIKE